MEVKVTQTGAIETNTYLSIDRETMEALIFDPGDEGSRLIDWIEKLGVKLKGILITHGHFDHIGAVNLIKNHFHVPVYAHESEARMMADPQLNLSQHFINRSIVCEATHFVKEGEVLDFGGKLSFRAIIVSGHTENSVCYYNEKHRVLISGDTIFAGSIGRTDFCTYDNEYLVKNIIEKLFDLPGETTIYPGHGNKTKIETEKESNPYFL